MISGLAQEVEKRMSHVEVKGSKITLKLKQRKAELGEEAYYRLLEPLLVQIARLYEANSD